jgi:Tfp pilus assembly protein PilV
MRQQWTAAILVALSVGLLGLAPVSLSARPNIQQEYYEWDTAIKAMRQRLLEWMQKTQHPAAKNSSLGPDPCAGFRSPAVPVRAGDRSGVARITISQSTLLNYFIRANASKS